MYSRTIDTTFKQRQVTDREQTLFGMNFFVFDSTHRRIVIANDFWVFLATWLPLTLVTVAIYLFIVWYDARSKQKEPRWPWTRRPRIRLPSEREKPVDESASGFS